MVWWFKKDQPRMSPTKPAWLPFHNRFPSEVWSDFENIPNLPGGVFSPNSGMNIFTVVSTALSELVGEDHFLRFEELIGLNRPIPMEEKREARTKALAWQEALSPDDRTRFLVAALRIRCFSRHLTKSQPNAFEDPECLPPFPKEASHFWFDPTVYPAYSGRAYLDGYSSWDGKIIEIAEQPLAIDEALATDFLRLAVHKNGRFSFFCKGITRHVVAHVRKEPGPEYLAVFREAAAYFASPEGQAIARTSYMSKTLVQLREMIARNLHHVG
jgi:hypothetical protein